MQNRDWEQLGEKIRRTVQDAIDSQDFKQLNQTINNTINEAAQSVYSGIKNASQNTRQVKKPTSAANLYAKPTVTRVGSIIMVVMGSIFGALGGVTVFTLLIVALCMGTLPTGFLAAIIGMGILILASVTILVKGISKLGKLKRFSLYFEQVRETGYCDIKRLCEVTKKSSKKVIKDLNDMTARRWFKEGHLDEQKTYFITDNEVYREYQLMMESQRESEKTERIQKESEAKHQESLSPEIRDILAAGDEFISKIHACNDAIPGTEISVKIARMEELVDRIFDRVEQDPSSVSSIHKLMNYYLPTTIKLLEAYEDLDSQPIQGDNILSSKQEIEKTLDTLNTAFEKLLDDLFERTAWDVSSDISVLNTMLAQEGLKHDDFK